MVNKQPDGISPGIYYGLSDEDYHADPAISSSGIKALLPEEEKDKENPMEYWDSSVLNPEREPLDTNALRYGRAYHALLLEPEKFKDGFIVLPPVNDIKLGSEVWAKLRDSEDGVDFCLPEGKGTVVRYGGKKIVISESDYADMIAMKREIMRSPQLSTLITKGHSEVSIFWIDQETGIRCRVRFDKWLNRCAIGGQFISCILDLKTIAAGTKSKRKLRYESGDRGHPVSAALYLEGLKQAIINGWCEGEIHNNFLTLFQGKKRPHTPRIMRINDSKLEKGYQDFRLGLQIYQENIEKYGTNRWSDDNYYVEDLFDEQQ